MLWDVIRDFFVKYVFGGYSNLDGEFYDVGIGILSNDEEVINELRYPIGLSTNGNQLYMSLGDWLSTTATIISIVIIVYLCCMLIKQIYNICAHVIG